MAQVISGHVYQCEGHSQKGHELAANHPVIVVGRQSLIENQSIAIVVPLTSTPPHQPVHWAVEIEDEDKDTNSYAYVRHIKSVHISKIGDHSRTAKPTEMESIKEGLARELQYENHENATALGQEVRPGNLWSASIPNARGQNFEGDLLILTSNRDTGMVTALAVDPQPRRDPMQFVPVTLQHPEQRAFAITYQVRAVATEERLTGFRGEIQDRFLTFAKAALLRCIGA